MNTLTKNRIIEKGDEYLLDGKWQPVTNKLIGLQVMFSGLTQVRRPSETLVNHDAKVTDRNETISPDVGNSGTGTIAKAESDKPSPVPSHSGTGDTLPNLPKLEDIKIPALTFGGKVKLILEPKENFPDPALDAMEREESELKATSRLPTVISRKAHEPPRAIPKVTVHPSGKTVRIMFPAGAPDTTWIGRNGAFANRGLNLHRYSTDVIAVVPQGRRGAARNAIIEFPVSVIPEVIAWLEEQIT